ncbi:unnamed protein product [Oikopleura dioica]|uniref:SET domain-containing protein n=1 Tax=Oikopleura dioica TaxID=34765 RepID=E4XHN2_OIKDI|nr:unnamed protein product [Oikopleura dioica]
MSLHESEDIENAGQSEVCSSSEPILISSSEYEANNSDRSVAEFFYKRDAVPKGRNFAFKENMSLDMYDKFGLPDKNSLLCKLALSERKDDPTRYSFLWFLQQLRDFSYLPYHEMTKFSVNGQNDMRDKSKHHFGIPPFPPEFRCGCSCEDGCHTMKCECRRRSVIANSKQKRVFKEDYWEKEKSFFGYDKNGLLTKTTLEPIQAHKKLPTVSYSECNSSCRCHDNRIRFCYNGITSDINSPYKTELFLTKNKGWGLRAADNIPAGAHITEYTGVIQPIADYYEHGRTNGNKMRFHNKNAVEMLDSYFRKSLTLIPDGEKLNKFDKESVLAKKLLDTTSHRRKYMFNVDPIHDIVEQQIGKHKENPMTWLVYKMEDREEIELIEDKKNSSRVLRNYAYDQAYYGSFTIDAALFGNEARFINGCCKKEYSVKL